MLHTSHPHQERVFTYPARKPSAFFRLSVCLSVCLSVHSLLTASRSSAYIQLYRRNCIYVHIYIFPSRLSIYSWSTFKSIYNETKSFSDHFVRITISQMSVAGNRDVPYDTGHLAGDPFLKMSKRRPTKNLVNFDLVSSSTRQSFSYRPTAIHVNRYHRIRATTVQLSGTRKFCMDAYSK